MINSVNALEFLKPKLITMDKFNTTTTTKLLPPSSSLSQTRTFVTITGHHLNTANNNSIEMHQEKQQHQQLKQHFLLNDEIKNQQQQEERVKVQHLENHTKLQNNKCWNNFRTLYNNVSASSAFNVKDREMCTISTKTKDDHEIDVVNVEHLTPTTITPINIQNKSAFTLDLKNKKFHNNNNNNDSICGNKNNMNNIKMNSSRIDETSNNNNIQFICKQYNNNINYGLINKQSPPTTMIVMSTTIAPRPEQSTAIPTTQRTEDQNKAYRHIESVHNYAKSKSYEDEDDGNLSPNGSRHSSYLDDEDDEDDEDEDNDVDADDIDAEYDNDEQSIVDDLDADYEDIFNRRRHRRFQKLSTSSDGALTIRSNKLNNIEMRTSKFLNLNVSKDHPKIETVHKKYNSNQDEDGQIDIDVETVESQLSPTIPIVSNSLVTLGGDSAVLVKPDHHARRPMNAFLIFCKRHRAIVKERYKNLENRAITKILGDWWASLDTNDKKCFTTLAQQNKDAFFSANPNFKWYKLPAPPLRTLTTRPANAFGLEYAEDNEVSPLEIISNNTRSSNNNPSNYFKLADEAQMGDLSQLMHDKSKATKQCTDLQQALGETSQFMSVHITGNAMETVEENRLKRRFHNESSSFSSNSSEEDSLEPKKKSARSCKGKRYQELINSGQIATAVKKSKSSMRLSVAHVGGEHNEVTVKPSLANNLINNHLFGNNAIISQKRSVSESDNMLTYDLNGFDLEERIKELPALNLDDYLQRKRNTKKKKKFSSNGKKRGQRSNASSSSSHNAGNPNDKDTFTASASNEHLQQLRAKQQQPATNAAVGSQKRKARKESITRRDVSAIEQEVASLLPLTINGCCYFQEAPTALQYIKAIEKDTETNGAATAITVTPQSLNVVTSASSTIIPSSSVSVDILNNNNDTTNITSNNSNTINDNISSSTSDLLILAEVAANRTELKH